MDAYFRIPSLRSEVTIPEDGIVSRALFQDENVKVVIFGFSAGQELSEHTASIPAITHFLDGSARVTLGTEESVAVEGSWFYMNPNLLHSIRATTPTKMLLVLLKPKKATVAGATA